MSLNVLAFALALTSKALALFVAVNTEVFALALTTQVLTLVMVLTTKLISVHQDILMLMIS